MKNFTHIQDTRINTYSNISSPEWLWELLPLTAKAERTVFQARTSIENILIRKSKKKFFVVGPCSVHNSEELKHYAKELKKTADKIADKICVVLRVNIEKPRTFADWPGFLEDPDRDGSNNIEKGRYLSRKLLLEINETGLPCATEYVNTSTPQYIGDLISWTWIGARTVESQMHKRMASGISTAVGFKNSSLGDVNAAINAIITAKSPNKFPGISPNGKEAIISTKGNDFGMVILRGGEKPNHHPHEIEAVQQKLKIKKLAENVVVDCSHGNSGKDHTRQPDVFFSVVDEMKKNTGLCGLMLESYLKSGKQSDSEKPLKHGVSITDACVDLKTTTKLLLEAHKILG